MRLIKLGSCGCILLLSALVLASCSSAGRSGPAAGSASIAPSSSVTGDSGRTLSEAQLLQAGLTLSELPKAYTFNAAPDSGWAMAQPAPRMPTPDKNCQPLIDLIFGTSDAAAEVSTDYQGFGTADAGSIKLFAYASGRAGVFFGAVGHALNTCSGLTYHTYIGAEYATFERLPSPDLGDDSMSIGMVVHDSHSPVVERFDFVRVGYATVLVTLIGFTTTPPPSPRPLLAAQVAKLGATQS